MDIKILTEEEFNKIYPTYKEGKIKKEKFIKLYSVYRHYLEKYLNALLNLTSLNKKIKTNGILITNIYHSISNLKLDYVFLLNNIMITNLRENQLLEFDEITKTKDETKITDFITNTFKDLLDCNKTLIIGVSVILDETLENYLKDKCSDYSRLLQIPVHIKNIYNMVEKDRLELLKNNPKYLPIGSIVILNGETKKLMIIGHGQIDLSKKEEIYDYIGCSYPQGIIKSEINILFNHEDIKSIIALGFKDEEETIYMKKLNNLLNAKEKTKEILKRI